MFDDETTVSQPGPELPEQGVRPTDSPEAIAAPAETSLSPATWAEVQQYIDGKIQDAVQAFLPHVETLVQNAAAAFLDHPELANKLEKVKADVIEHFTPMLTEIVSKSAAPMPGPVTIDLLARAITEKPERELAIDDPVKVWTDPEHKTFRLGKIAGIHDGASAYDVELDGGGLAKIPAGGVEFDDRA